MPEMGIAVFVFFEYCLPKIQILTYKRGERYAVKT